MSDNSKRFRRSPWFLVVAVVLPAIVLICVGGIVALVIWAELDARPRTVANWPGGFVDHPGAYTMADGHVFTVNIDNRGIVRYDFKSPSGVSLLTMSKASASAYQRWFFYLDDQQRLWFESSDVGTFVWLPQPDGTYAEEPDLMRSRLAHQFPPAFYERMGSSAAVHFSQAK